MINEFGWVDGINSLGSQNHVDQVLHLAESLVLDGDNLSTNGSELPLDYYCFERTVLL